MITRGKDLELLRLRADVDELSRVLYRAWPYVLDNMCDKAKRGEYTDSDAKANKAIYQTYQAIALPRVDAGREDAA